MLEQRNAEVLRDHLRLLLRQGVILGGGWVKHDVCGPISDALVRAPPPTNQPIKQPTTPTSNQVPTKRTIQSTHQGRWLGRWGRRQRRWLGRRRRAPAGPRARHDALVPRALAAFALIGGGALEAGHAGDIQPPAAPALGQGLVASDLLDRGICWWVGEIVWGG